MSGLVASNVGVNAGGRTILNGVSFDAPAGAVTGLIGPNGAGKSTLIGATLGLRRRIAGSIVFDGADLPGMPAAERAKRCAYVEQFATTAERLTVRDVVALGRLPFQTAWQTVPTPHDDAVVTDALAQLGVTGFADRLYQSLSGGEQQRVQIARALAQEPALLLLDEPTSHLDIRSQLLVLDLLHRRAAQGCTVVVALHDLNLAARYCDHLVALQSGKVAAEGAPLAVLTPELLLRVYGVAGSILQLPGTTYPTIIYDQADTHEN